MTGVLFLAAFAGLPLVGAGTLLSRRWTWLGIGGGVASAAAVGAVILGAEMFAATVVGLRWTLWILLALPAAAISIALRGRRATADLAAPARTDRLTPVAIALLGLAGAAVAIVAYAAMTARVTSTDLLYFWGSKGERFTLAGRIDADFLGRPDHFLMHSDYPPLWPCLYAFGTMLGGRFAWGASLATLPFFLLLGSASVWSFGRRSLGSVEAAALAAAYAALFGFLLSDGLTAGNADGPLLFFETLALCLLVFARQEPGAFLLAGLALAGAAWLKLEGIAFGWAVIGAAVLAIRPLPPRKLGQLAAPPLFAYVAWMIFCRAHGLLDSLGRHTWVLTGDRFRSIAASMVQAARMGSHYLAWAVVISLFVIRRPGRTAVFAVLVAGLIAAFDGGVYLAARSDPTDWIAMAGERTLMTPLLALLLAAMAPSQDIGRSSPAP